MKRPTQTALKTSLFALMAAKDVIGKDHPEWPKEIAARALLGAMSLTQSPELLKEAQVEVVRACMITGIDWR